MAGEGDNTGVLIEGEAGVRHLRHELIPHRVHLGDPHASDEALGVGCMNTCADCPCDGGGVARWLHSGHARGALDAEELGCVDVLHNCDARSLLKGLCVEHQLRRLTHAGDRDAQQRLVLDDLLRDGAQVADVGVGGLQGADEGGGATRLEEALSGLDLGGVDLGEVADCPACVIVIAPLVVIGLAVADHRERGMGQRHAPVCDPVRVETNLRAWVGPHVLGREERHARLSPLLGHLDHLLDRLSALRAIGDDPCADVGVGALWVVLPPIASLRPHHEVIILIEDGDGGRAPDAT